MAFDEAYQLHEKLVAPGREIVGGIIFNHALLHYKKKPLLHARKPGQ
jgi:hypothetical protein